MFLALKLTHQTGPIFWGPISDQIGRSILLKSAYMVYLICNVPVALALNIPILLVFRFLAGTFASSALSIVPGIIADIWVGHARTVVATGLLLFIFAGTSCGPVVGQIILDSAHLSWRWASWVNMMGAAVLWLLSLVLLDETSSMVILRRKTD